MASHAMTIATSFVHWETIACIYDSRSILDHIIGPWDPPGGGQLLVSQVNGGSWICLALSNHSDLLHDHCKKVMKLSATHLMATSLIPIVGCTSRTIWVLLLFLHSTVKPSTDYLGRGGRGLPLTTMWPTADLMSRVKGAGQVYTI